MTREEASNIWQVIKAYGEGKDIQYQTIDGNWLDNEDMDFSPQWKYRIKPEEDNWEEVKKQLDESKKHLIPVPKEEQSAFICWKCNRVLPISEQSNVMYPSNPPKYSCKECEKTNHYRPFKDCDELVATYHKKAFTPIAAIALDSNLKKMYRPEIWVKSKFSGTEYLISAYGSDCTDEK